MILDEFLETTERIEKFYDKEYNQEQRKMIFETFKDKPKERYRQIALQVFRTSKFLPKLADLIEIDQTLPKEKQQEKERIKCPKCNGTGMIIYAKVIPNMGEYQYAARCDCLNAEGISNAIPLASELGI